MALNVVIQGYYGYGNFGDDLLLLSAYKIVRKVLPGANITIFTWSRQPAYLRKLLPSVAVENEHVPPCDIIIHGGGGVFFDFEQGSTSDWIFNRLISLLGPRIFGRLLRMVKRESGLPIRVGLGLGIGTYTKSSRRFRYEIGQLTNFKFLMVRDGGSVTNLHSIGVHNAIIGTDLVFDFPFDDYVTTDAMPGENEIAFILRDWKYSESAYLDEMLESAHQLRQQGHAVRMYSFDPGADEVFLKKSSSFPQTLWNPAVSSAVTDFLRSLKRSRVIVSSRAHGIIVAACLKIPCVGVNIEPKIEAVVNLVPESSKLVSPSSAAGILAAVDGLINDPPSGESMDLALARNRAILKDSLDKLSSTLTNTV